MCLLLSVLATSVGIYHAREQSELYQSIPPFVIAAVLFGAALFITFSNWAKKRKGTQIIGVCKQAMEEADGSK